MDYLPLNWMRKSSSGSEFQPRGTGRSKEPCPAVTYHLKKAATITLKRPPSKTMK